MRLVHVKPTALQLELTNMFSAFIFRAMNDARNWPKNNELSPSRRPKVTIIIFPSPLPGIFGVYGFSAVSGPLFASAFMFETIDGT